MSTSPWQSTGYWSTLGLNDNATVKAVRSAYMQLALKQHPDKVPVAEREEATEKFKVLKNAYDFCLVAATIRPDDNDDFYSSQQSDDNSSSYPWPDNSHPSSWSGDPNPPPTSHNHGPSYSNKSHKAPRERSEREYYNNFDTDPKHGNYQPLDFSDIDEDACFNDPEADVWVYKKLANNTWRHAINKKHLDLFLARKRLETFQRQMAAAEARAPILDRPKYNEAAVEARRTATKVGLEAELEGLEGAEEERMRKKAKKQATAPKGVLPGDKAMLEEGYTRDAAGGWRKATSHAPVQGDGDEPVDFQRGRAVGIGVTTKEEEFWDSWT